MSKIYLFLCLLLLLSCNTDQTAYFPEKDTLHSDLPLVLDTILEKNTPQALDMTRHQLFIDTSRGSYKQKVALEESTLKTAINNLLADLNKVAHSTSIRLPTSFPSHFTCLHQLKKDGTFVLYDRCDGSDPIYIIADNHLLKLGPLDLSVYTINKVITVHNDKLHLKLNTINRYIDDKSISKVVDFKISHTDNPYIFEMELNNRLIHLVSIKDTDQFDIIVNHCPTQKVAEYAQGDN